MAYSLTCFRKKMFMTAALSLLLSFILFWKRAAE